MVVFAICLEENIEQVPDGNEYLSNREYDERALLYIENIQGNCKTKVEKYDPNHSIERKTIESGFNTFKF